MSPERNPAWVRVKSGGDDGIRTHDLCSAIAALSQLSYIPTRTT